MKRLVLSLIVAAAFAVPAQAAKDLAEWTEVDISGVVPVLQGALRSRIELAKRQAATEEGAEYRNAEERLVDRIAPFGEVCKAGDECGGAAAAAPVVAAAGRSGSDVYSRHCFACHGTGVAGAPKLGDAEAWASRIDKGMETMLSNTLNGFNNNIMPPMGTCMDCSEDELQAAIDHMIAEQ